MFCWQSWDQPSEFVCVFLRPRWSSSVFNYWLICLMCRKAQYKVPRSNNQRKKKGRRRRKKDRNVVCRTCFGGGTRERSSASWRCRGVKPANKLTTGGLHLVTTHTCWWRFTVLKSVDTFRLRGSGGSSLKEQCWSVLLKLSLNTIVTSTGLFPMFFMQLNMETKEQFSFSPTGVWKKYA